MDALHTVANLTGLNNVVERAEMIMERHDGGNEGDGRTVGGEAEITFTDDTPGIEVQPLEENV